MARAAAKRPSGKVSAVFDRSKDREGAYDFLESPHVKPEALAESVFAATVARARGGGDEYVYVASDGSSLSLTDQNGAKGFGPVGRTNWPVRGLKVMNALAVARDGVPLGLVDQIFWNRSPTQEGLTRAERTQRNRKRAFEEKEPWYFLAAAKNAIERLECEGLRAWVVIDREGDDRNILLGLHRAGCVFTVRGGRGNWDRRLWPDGEQSVREMLDARVQAVGLDPGLVGVAAAHKRGAITARGECAAELSRAHTETAGLTVLIGSFEGHHDDVERFRSEHRRTVCETGHLRCRHRLAPGPSSERRWQPRTGAEAPGPGHERGEGPAGGRRFLRPPRVSQRA